MEREKNRIAALDGLKGIAAVLIACVYHLPTVPFPYENGLPFYNNSIILWIYNYGYLFVELFFVISGYLFFYCYSPKIDNGLEFTPFIKKRVLRIYPLMFVTLLWALLGTVWFWVKNGHNFWLGFGNNSILTFALNCMGMQAFFPIGQSWNYPAWSLTIFFMCWILFYVIIKNIKKGRIYACIAFVLLGMSIQLSLLPTGIPLLTLDASRGYISFFAGGIVYYLYTWGGVFRKGLCFSGLIFLIILLGLSIIEIPVGNIYTLFGAFVFPIILYIALENKMLNKILSLKPLVYLGKISFPIYLCNFPIEIMMEILCVNYNVNIDFSSGMFFVTNIIIHIIIGIIFHIYFEKKLPNKLLQVLQH